MIKAYLDSCMVISLIEGSIIQQQLIRQSLVGRSVFSSELARLEVLIAPIRENDRHSLHRFDQFFATCKIPDFDRAVFKQATRLRVNSKLKTPDALHLAVAVIAGCQEFWTEDKQLKAIADQYLTVVDWDQLRASE